MPGVAGGAFVAARSATISDERAEEIVSALLTDIYHAFDFRDDDVIGGCGAGPVVGDLLL